MFVLLQTHNFNIQFQQLLYKNQVLNMGKKETPKLSGILDTAEKAPSLKYLTKPRALTAVAMLLFLWFLMWVAVHELQIYAITYPLLLPLYPVIGISTIVLSTPLILYIFNAISSKNI
eukprot:TRINITY_DN2314_c0_g2_i3.p3 TRINITY_DN2314_c0_g2~~TRINITY_DN2314_c0_g2_i3.p3  ORF type:complete len:130 (-),score=3.14 TRINITY_DN2314_c0_g2_i3:461-814(-)